MFIIAKKLHSQNQIIKDL